MSDNEKNKEFWEALKPLQDAYTEGMNLYHKHAMEWWDKLDYDDKCFAFYAVVNQMYKAEVEERGTYRYALYDVFDFGMDMYGVAMDAGYMELHNLIHDGLERKKNAREIEES